MVNFNESALKERLTNTTMFDYLSLLSEGAHKIDEAVNYTRSLNQYEQLGKPDRNGVQLSQTMRDGLTSLHMTLIPTLIFSIHNQALFFMHDDANKFVYIAHYNNRTHVSEVVMNDISNEQFIKYLNAAVVNIHSTNPDLPVNVLRCAALRTLADEGLISMMPVKIETSRDRDLYVCRYYQYAVELGYTDNYKHFRLSYLCLRGLRNDLFNQFVAANGALTLNHMDNHRSLLNVDNYELCTVAENNKHAYMIKELSHMKQFEGLFNTVIDYYTRSYGTYEVNGVKITGRLPHFKVQIAEPFCLSATNVDKLAKFTCNWQEYMSGSREEVLREHIEKHTEQFYEGKAGKLDIYALVKCIVTYC